MTFTPRLTIPEDGNPYYNTKSAGGYSSAIKGSPTEPGLNVLRNCVGYANGRYAEIQGLKKIKYQLVCNAEQFIIKAESYGLQIGNVPKLGSIMVWGQGTTKSGSDGAGHVAIVEQINPDGSIVTSESGYNAKRAFWTQKRTNANSRWGQNTKYTFLGFIYNPAVEDSNPKDEIYIVKPGDNLTKIARMYDVNIWTLARVNHINNINLIRVGQKLVIPR